MGTKVHTIRNKALLRSQGMSAKVSSVLTPGVPSLALLLGSSIRKVFRIQEVGLFTGRHHMPQLHRDTPSKGTLLRYPIREGSSDSGKVPLDLYSTRWHFMLCCLPQCLYGDRQTTDFGYEHIQFCFHDINASASGLERSCVAGPHCQVGDLQLHYLRIRQLSLALGSSIGCPHHSQEQLR